MHVESTWFFSELRIDENEIQVKIGPPGRTRAADRRAMSRIKSWLRIAINFDIVSNAISANRPRGLTKS